MSFRFRSATPKRAIYGIDATEPYELAPTVTKVTGSIEVIKLSGDGGAEAAGFAAPYPELSREKYFSLTLVEVGTDLIIFRADRCSLTDQAWSVPSRGFVTGSFEFEALEWDNGQSTKTNHR